MTSIAIPSRMIQGLAALETPEQFREKVLGLDLSGVHVMANWVLVAPYIRPEKTSGGIIRPDANVEEDLWQGKSGLVLKLGPQAFKDDAEFSFYGEKCDIGEWCVFWVGDARNITVKGIPCRLVRDNRVNMKVSNPNLVF